MTKTKVRQKQDADVQTIKAALKGYQREHPTAEIRLQRQNSVSIRIRIIDPSFEDLGLADREPAVWKELDKLPERVFSQITMLLLLTPAESRSSLANMEFDDPIRSKL